MIRRFTLEGVGCVECDGTSVPLITFEDGRSCPGLSRSACEIAPLGYKPDELMEANFIHEALHLYLPAKIGKTKMSVQHRAADFCTFTSPTVLADANEEERLVIGVQAYVNRAHKKTRGFHYHIAGAVIENARRNLSRKHGLKIGDVARDFLRRLNEGDTISLD